MRAAVNAVVNAGVTVALLLAPGAGLAQEREVPKDSARIAIPGCARGRSFIVMPRDTVEPVRSDVQPGRRFRLNGPKKLLEEIKQQQANYVEVTGLVRKAQLDPSQGVSIAGGRVRIGGGPVNRDPTQSDPRRDPRYNEVVMDVESWRPLPETCPER
jgi:hypothetical protein